MKEGVEYYMLTLCVSKEQWIRLSTWNQSETSAGKGSGWMAVESEALQPDEFAYMVAEKLKGQKWPTGLSTISIECNALKGGEDT